MDHRCALLGSHLRGDRARLTTTGTGTVTSACCLVRLDNCLRDASAVVHLVSVLPSPVADCSRLLTVRTSGLLVGRLGPTTAAVPRPARRRRLPERAPRPRLRLRQDPRPARPARVHPAHRGQGPARTDPGRPPLASRTYALVAQRLRQAASLHRQTQGRRRVLALPCRRVHRDPPADQPGPQPLPLADPTHHPQATGDRDAVHGADHAGAGPVGLLDLESGHHRSPGDRMVSP